MGRIFCCTLVAIASAFGKGDQLFAMFVLFGLGGFILLRYLGYFRFEFFGEGLTNLIENRKSSKSLEQSVKEAELIISQSVSLESLSLSLAKAAEGLQFQEAKISFFSDNGRLGTALDSKNPNIGKVFSWSDRNQTGYFSRDNEFSVEFPISGRNFSYAIAKYRFMDGRSSLTVQEEILLERIHDAISNLAGRLRKTVKIG